MEKKKWIASIFERARQEGRSERLGGAKRKVRSKLLFVHIVLARCERALAATLGERGRREEESAAPVRDGIV